MESKFFDIAEARLVCEQFPIEETCDYLNLSAYEYADPEAFEYLASRGERGSLDNIGLRQLDVRTASALLSCSSCLHFVNLERLEREVAAVLSQTNCLLSIDRLRDAKTEPISELVKCRGSLFLSFEDKLTMEIATELARHRHELFVTVPEQPPINVQLKLLFAYSGHSVILQFPFEGEKFNSDFLYLSHRFVRVEQIKGGDGKTRCNITASDSAESWREKMEFVQRGEQDALPDD